MELSTHFLHRPKDVIATLQAFREAIGEPQWVKSYGPEGVTLFPERVVYTFLDPTERYLTHAWGSIFQDLSEPIVWLSYGVWPHAQRKGVKRQVRAWLVDQAFNVGPSLLTHCGIHVLDTNPEEQARCFKDEQADGWLFAGHLGNAYPSPGAIFTLTREEWSVKRGISTSGRGVDAESADGGQSVGLEDDDLVAEGAYSAS